MGSTGATRATHTKLYTADDWSLGRFEKPSRYATYETADGKYRVIYIKLHGQGWTLEERDDSRRWRTIPPMWGFADRKTAIQMAVDYINKSSK